MKDEIFCFNGNNGDYLKLLIEKVIGFPDSTSYEGGYDIVCTLIIKAGSYKVESENHYSATGALYRFAEELKICYSSLAGIAKYSLLLENNLIFNVEMTSLGHAVIIGEFQENTAIQNILKFEIETDQSCFKEVIDGIENLKSTLGGMEGLKGAK